MITVRNGSIRVHKCVVQISATPVGGERPISHLDSINGECEICERGVTIVVIHYTECIDRRASKNHRDIQLSAVGCSVVPGVVKCLLVVWLRRTCRTFVTLRP